MTMILQFINHSHKEWSRITPNKSLPLYIFMTQVMKDWLHISDCGLQGENVECSCLLTGNKGSKIPNHLLSFFKTEARFSLFLLDFYFMGAEWWEDIHPSLKKLFLQTNPEWIQVLYIWDMCFSKENFIWKNYFYNLK